MPLRNLSEHLRTNLILVGKITHSKMVNDKLVLETMKSKLVKGSEKVLPTHKHRLRFTLEGSIDLHMEFLWIFRFDLVV